MGFRPVNVGLPRPFRSRVRSRQATDRQTDRHRSSFHERTPYGGLVIIVNRARQQIDILIELTKNLSITRRLILNISRLNMSVINSFVCVNHNFTYRSNTSNYTGKSYFSFRLLPRYLFGYSKC